MSSRYVFGLILYVLFAFVWYMALCFFYDLTISTPLLNRGVMVLFGVFLWLATKDFVGSMYSIIEEDAKENRHGG